MLLFDHIATMNAHSIVFRSIGTVFGLEGFQQIAVINICIDMLTMSQQPSSQI